VQPLEPKSTGSFRIEHCLVASNLPLRVKDKVFKHMWYYRIAGNLKIFIFTVFVD